MQKNLFHNMDIIFKSNNNGKKIILYYKGARVIVIFRGWNAFRTIYIYIYVLLVNV